MFPLSLEQCAVAALVTAAIVAALLVVIARHAADIARLQLGAVLARKGSTRRAIVFFYSHTGNARAVAARIATGLGAAGDDVTLHEIKTVDPFPSRSAIAFARAALRALLRVPVRIEPVDLAGRDPDLVVVVTQTWFMGMSAPIQALLESPAHRALFGGRDAAAVVVCRGAWRRTQAMAIRALERQGARVVASRAWCHEGREPGRLLALGLLLVRGSVPAGLSPWIPDRCGPSDQALDDAERFGSRLAHAAETPKASGDA